MSETTVPKGKAIELPESGDEDFFPTDEDLKAAREFLDDDPVLLAMFDAETDDE